MTRLWQQRFQQAARQAASSSVAQKSVFAKMADVNSLAMMAVASGGVIVELVNPDGTQYFLIRGSDLNAETDALDNA